MVFLALYGDRRISLTVERLKEEGHTVTHLTEGGSSAIQSAVEAAPPDACLLPIPVSRDGVFLTGSDCTLLSLAAALPKDAAIFGGRIPEAFKGHKAVDFLTDESFALKNADLTAEGVIRILYNETEKSLTKTHVLFLGYGRIAACLLPRLRALGVRVSVACRRPEAQTRAAFWGASVYSMQDALPDADFIVNHAPPPFSPENLPKGLFIDLAGLPTPEEGSPLFGRFLAAPALPGRFFPESAADIILDHILKSV